eukprot:s1386_g2.t4
MSLGLSANVGMFDVVRETCKLLTEWTAKRREQGLPEYHVGTGGGPGMMAAANEGAAQGKGKSIGFGISVPFEDGLNPYVTPELGFEFHYFFTRKFWMAFKCMGLVVAPGGFGTADELFELLTLMQTGKIKRQLPIILIGKKFWTDCIQWDAFVHYGMISDWDAQQLRFADTAEDSWPWCMAKQEVLRAHHDAASLVRLKKDGIQVDVYHFSAATKRYPWRIAYDLLKEARQQGLRLDVPFINGAVSEAPWRLALQHLTSAARQALRLSERLAGFVWTQAEEAGDVLGMYWVLARGFSCSCTLILSLRSRAGACPLRSGAGEDEEKEETEEEEKGDKRPYRRKFRS